MTDRGQNFHTEALTDWGTWQRQQHSGLNDPAAQRSTKRMLPPSGSTGYHLPATGPFRVSISIPSAAVVYSLLHIKPVKSQTAQIPPSEVTNKKNPKNRSTLPAGGGSFKTRLDWRRFSYFSRKWPSNCCSLLNKRQTHRVVFCILFYKVIVHSEVPVRQKRNNY